jgi:hypothetical protein
MATSTYLSNPVVTVNSVDLTDQCTAATFTHRFDSLEATSFGDTSRNFVKGLGNHEVTLSLYMSYAAAETYATLAALVGTATNVEIQSATGTPSPTAPNFVLTGGFLAELPVINSTMGELSTVDITFVGGDFAVVTAGP